MFWNVYHWYMRADFKGGVVMSMSTLITENHIESEAAAVSFFGGVASREKYLVTRFSDGYN